MKDIFLIDADDTIFDFHGPAEEAIEYAFSSCGIEWKKDLYADIYRTVNNGLWERLERKEISRDELMDCRFPLFLSVLGIAKVDGREVNKRYVEYLSSHPRYFEGAESFLQTLRGRGRVYIVTNGTEYIQRARFTIARLWEKTDDVFISQTTGYDKPDPRYTQFVCKHIENFDKERAVWIGDSLSADIRAANEAGITSIWYNPKQKTATGEVKPDYSVQNFTEILQILENI